MSYVQCTLEQTASIGQGKQEDWKLLPISGDCPEHVKCSHLAESPTAVTSHRRSSLLNPLDDERDYTHRVDLPQSLSAVRVLLCCI